MYIDTHCHLSKEDTTYLCSILDRIMHAKEDRSELFRLFIHIALFHIFFDKQESDTPASSNDIGQYIDDLIIKVRPANLCETYSKRLSSQNRDLFRAEIVAKKLLKLRG